MRSSQPSVPGVSVQIFLGNLLAWKRNNQLFGAFRQDHGALQNIITLTVLCLSVELRRARYEVSSAYARHGEEAYIRGPRAWKGVYVAFQPDPRNSSNNWPCHLSSCKTATWGVPYESVMELRRLGKGLS